MNNVIYVLGGILNSVVPFLFLPILSRTLEPEEYGQMNLLLTVYALVMPFTSISLAGYLYKRYFDEKNISWKLFEKCFSVLIKWVLFVFLFSIIMCSAFYFFSIGSKLFLTYIPLLVLASFCNAIFICRLQIYTAQSKPYKFLLVQLSYTLLIFILTLCFLFFVDLNYLSRILGVVLVDTLYAISSFRSMKKEFTNTLIEIKVKEERDFIIYGFGLMPHLVASVLLSTADKIIITMSLSLSDLAVYAIAVQFTSILMVFTIGLNKEWSRQYFKLPDFRKQKKRMSVLLFLVALCGVFLYLFKGVFYNIFVGESLRKGFDVVVVLIFSQIFHSVYIFVSVYIKHNGKTYVLSLLTLVSLLINVVVSLFLVNDYGLIGVAYGTLIGMFFKFVLVTLYINGNVRKKVLI